MERVSHEIASDASKMLRKPFSTALSTPKRPIISSLVDKMVDNVDSLAVRTVDKWRLGVPKRKARRLGLFGSGM